MCSMEESGFDTVRSSARPWAQYITPVQQQQQQQQQLHQQSGAASPSLLTRHSPKTPQSAYMARGIMPSPMQLNISLPGSNSISIPSTPTASLPPHSSLLALEAKSAGRDIGQHIQQHQKQKQKPHSQHHLRLDIASEDKWRRLGARVLPVFNGDRLQSTVEENTEVVRSCLRSDMDSAWPELHNILRMGMASLVRILYRSLNIAPKFESGEHGRPWRTTLAMLSISGIANHDGLHPHVFVDGLAGIWETLFSHALPFLEGVFLPLSQFGIASPSSAGSLPSASLRNTNSRGPSVRHVTLIHFRDAIVVPLLGQLDKIAGMARVQGVHVADAWAYYQSLCVVLQMLTVLAALAPGERGQLHNTARTLSLALQS